MRFFLPVWSPASPGAVVISSTAALVLSVTLLGLVAGGTGAALAVPPLPPQLMNDISWTCDFPEDDTSIAPHEGALWLKAEHHGCCFSSYDYYGGSGDWCEDSWAEIRVFDEAGAEVPGETLYDGAEEDRYGDLLWMAEGSLSPASTYEARVFFANDACAGSADACMGEYQDCVPSDACFNQPPCESRDGEGCWSHIYPDFILSLQAASEPFPEIDVPEFSLEAVSARWVSEYGCFVPRARVVMEPPQISVESMPYLRYDLYRAVGGDEARKDRWGGAALREGTLRSDEFDWRSWSAGVTDEFCARVQVTAMPTGATASSMTCITADVLPGLEADEDAPWGTVPMDGPFCDSAVTPVPDGTAVIVTEPAPEGTTGDGGSGCHGAGPGPASSMVWLALALAWLGGGRRRA